MDHQTHTTMNYILIYGYSSSSEIQIYYLTFLHRAGSELLTLISSVACGGSTSSYCFCKPKLNISVCWGSTEMNSTVMGIPPTIELLKTATAKDASLTLKNSIKANTLWTYILTLTVLIEPHCQKTPASAF